MKAKLATLQSEFERLCELTAGLPFWNALFWEEATVSIKDWILVDAWYRSRCVELPTTGIAMVPALDMVNHSSQPSALYEVDGAEDVLLLVRPDASVPEGKEVTISYGEAKPASEMLFSYGFVDPTVCVSTVVLHLRPFPDDPLAAAKVHIFNGARIVTLSGKAGDEAQVEEDGFRWLTWHSPFVYLMCLNEEDGLLFQLLQDTEGGRQLRLFWQGEDVTERAGRDIESLIEGHKLFQVFRLRAVQVILQTVEEQLASMRSGLSDAEPASSRGAGVVRSECVAAAKMLKDGEAQMLDRAVEALRHEVRLLTCNIR